MQKIDYKKELKHLYGTTAKEGVVEVTVPPQNYLMVDGEGNPNTAQAYKEAVEALYSLAYTIKFIVKKSEAAIDYTVMPLEGLWWTDNMEEFSVERKGDWKWTMLIMQPPPVTQAIVAQALDALQEKNKQKKKTLPALAKVRFDTLEEGRAAQILHIGPFTAEGPTIEKLHHHIATSGHSLRAKHHEIYLSDIRKADPAKWKTIIRQPMA